MKIRFDEIFAVTAPGLEALCADEIGSQLDCEVVVEKGGVAFAGSLEDLYRVNLFTRLASRILVRVGLVRANDFPELHRKVKRLPWGRFVKPDMPIIVRSSSRRSRLNHTARISETVSDAINGALGRTGSPVTDPVQTILARFEDDNCQLSVDSSGELLHRRGYRTEISRAPLRETLAAGILSLLGWHGQMPLYDPMCGSGTFLIEAAMLANGRVPGIDRPFAFQSWPKYRDGLWKNLLNDARRNEQDLETLIAGSDIDDTVVAVANRNTARAGYADRIDFSCKDIAEVKAPAENGLVLCNPPYGIRVGEESELVTLYRGVGELYRSQFRGWQGALFCPSPELVAESGIDFKVVAELVNGGLATKLFTCQL
jgi:putative N6-adenine-specific DNA methylase